MQAHTWKYTCKSELRALVDDAAHEEVPHGLPVGSPHLAPEGADAQALARTSLCRRQGPSAVSSPPVWVH
eukprot:3471089-Lingulodinium_polyedra.AAC.1